MSCHICEAPDAFLGVPMYENLVLPNSHPGEWGGFPACRRCATLQLLIHTPIPVFDFKVIAGVHRQQVVSDLAELREVLVDAEQRIKDLSARDFDAWWSQRAGPSAAEVEQQESCETAYYYQFRY